MRIIETRQFRQAARRLHANEKRDLDAAVRSVAEDTAIGQEKTGDLIGVRVHKFRMVNQLALLAYSHDAADDLLTLIDFGSHENFYRDLKRD